MEISRSKAWRRVGNDDDGINDDVLLLLLAMANIRSNPVSNPSQRRTKKTCKTDGLCAEFECLFIDIGICCYYIEIMPQTPPSIAFYSTVSCVIIVCVSYSRHVSSYLAWSYV